MNIQQALLSSFALMLLGVTGPSAADDGSASKGAPVATKASELKWESSPRFSFITVARVWGAPDAAQGRFVKFSEKKVLPLHTHSTSIRIVVVSGTYVYARHGEPEKQFPPGSFVFTPGGMPHVAGCDGPCIYYEEFEGKPDFTPVTASK
jgi:quercetin dioxygenase-like cupin family protein